MTGAENQQERLIEFRGWVIGFVDGEGCFSIGLVRQPRRPGRAGYATGYQVSLYGLAGLLVARDEGVELDLLGLDLGIDLARPGIKLPGVGWLGVGGRTPA